MNEGIAKALRRQARARGLSVTSPGRGTVIPGKETKALWESMTHKERGQWRAKLAATRAKARRTAQRAAVRHFIGRMRDFPRACQEDIVDVLSTGRMSYANARAMLPRSR